MKFNINNESFLSIKTYKEHIENVLNIFSGRFFFYKKIRSFFYNVEMDNLHHRLVPVMLTFEQLSQIHEKEPSVLQEDLKEIFDANQLFWNGFFTYELTKNKKYGMYLMYRGIKVLKDKITPSIEYYINNNQSEMIWHYKIDQMQSYCSKAKVQYGNNILFKKYIKEVSFPKLIYFQQKKNGLLFDVSKGSLSFAREQAKKIVGRYNKNNTEITLESTKNFVKNYIAQMNTKIEITLPELKEKMKISSNVEKINIIEDSLNNILRIFSSTELSNQKIKLLNGLKNLNTLKDLAPNNDVVINHEINNVFGNNLINLLEIIHKTYVSNIDLLIENCALNNMLIERLIITCENDINNMMKVKNNILKEKIQNF